MEQDEGNQQQRQDVKIEKALAVEKAQENLENGIYEVYQYADGSSDVWEKFFKIRNCDTKAHVGFAQCIQCKTLLSFKEHSGTSHLSRHKCRKGKTDGGNYRQLAVDKVEQTIDLITKNTIKLCTHDFISSEAICDSGNLLEWAQSFVTLGYKHGNINLQQVFPNKTRVNRGIANVKDESMRYIYENFRESLKREWCSALFEVRNYGVDKMVVIVSIQYFKKELKALKRNVFFSIILDKDDTPHDFLTKLLKEFNICGGDKNELQQINIVTPVEKIITRALVYPYKRIDCVANIITNVLDAGFETNEIDNIMSLSRNTVSLINSYEKFGIHLKEDDGSYQSKVDMIRSIVENYDDIIRIMEKENNKNQLKFSKRKGEEVISFLEPFVEALEELSASTHPTANKILLWWKVLADHMKNDQNCSLEMKRIIANTKESFNAKFYPSMENKINCFLDPRYKTLKMLSPDERVEVITAVRTLLEDVDGDGEEEIPSNSDPGTKRSRFAQFEAEKNVKEKPKKKSRFESYESTNADLEDSDEVNIYLKLPAMKLETEFDIIDKFWKQKKKTLPKLFKLASTRLHVPACCGVSATKSWTTNENLKEGDLTDYIFVRDNV